MGRQRRGARPEPLRGPTGTGRTWSAARVRRVLARLGELARPGVGYSQYPADTGTGRPPFGGFCRDTYPVAKRASTPQKFFFTSAPDLVTGRPTAECVCHAVCPFCPVPFICP